MQQAFGPLPPSGLLEDDTYAATRGSEILEQRNCCVRALIPTLAVLSCPPVLEKLLSPVQDLLLVDYVLSSAIDKLPRCCSRSRRVRPCASGEEEVFPILSLLSALSTFALCGACSLYWTVRVIVSESCLSQLPCCLTAGVWPWISIPEGERVDCRRAGCPTACAMPQAASTAEMPLSVFRRAARFVGHGLSARRSLSTTLMLPTRDP